MNENVKNAQIIVVDDNKGILDILKKIFEKTGFKNVTYLPSSKEAYEVLKSQKIDLLITDVNMPEISGTELVSKIRSEEVLSKDVKVAVITAAEDPETLGALSGLSVDEIIQKPFNGKEFYNKVTALIDEKLVGEAE